MAGTTNMPDLRTRLTLDIGDFTRGLISARAQAGLFGGTIQDVGSSFKTAGIAMATFATIGLFTAGIVATAFIGAIGTLITLGVVSAAQSQAVQNEWTKTAQHILAGMQSASRAYEPVLMRLATLVSSTFDSIQPVLTEVFDRLAPIFEDVTDSFLGSFADIVRGLPDQINTIIAFLSSVGAAWDVSTDNMRSGWDEAVGAFGRDAQQFLNEALPGFGEFVGNVIALFAPIFDSATAFGGAFFDSLGAVSQEADDLLNRILPQLNDGFNHVAVTLGHLGGSILAALNGVGQPLEHLLMDLSEYGELISKYLPGLAPTLAGLLGSAAEAGHALMPVLEAVVRFIVQSGPALVAFSQLLVGMISGFVEGISPLLGDLGPDWAENFAQGIRAITPQMTELARLTGQFVVFLVQGAGMIINALGAVANTVGMLSGLFHDAGQNAGTALVVGIIAGLGFMISPLTGVMAGLVATVAAFLPRSPAEVGPLSGDGSPDQRGMKLGQMFADGIAASTSAVSDAAQKLVGGVGLPENPTNVGASGVGAPIIMPSGGASQVVNVYVAGSVVSERDLQDMIQKALLQREQRNAGSVVATSVRS